MHTIVHQFTVRSVACNKLQCQEGCGSDVKGNIIRQCHNKIINNGPSSWQLKSVLSDFKFFVSANELHVLLF